MRWARRDAEPFLARHPLPTEPLPVPGPAPYFAALAAAETSAEVSAVTQRFLDAAQSALSAVSDLLVAIARWGDRHRFTEQGSAPKLLMEAASRSLSVPAIADEADLKTLRAEYDPAPTSPAESRSERPQVPSALPPSPPPAPRGPAPGR
ncbi:hypothetical protein [Streptomyces mangrovi]|uniref:hypothetical protein n=1 Tax=Streptomyces mangrovi TaxID=1206892 RepID=UPI00399C4EA5